MVVSGAAASTAPAIIKERRDGSMVCLPSFARLKNASIVRPHAGVGIDQLPFARRTSTPKCEARRHEDCAHCSSAAEQLAENAAAVGPEHQRHPHQRAA